MFMLKSTHEAAMRELKAKAARDIEPLTQEIADLKDDRDEWKSAALGYEIDAQKWRDSLKRSRDRKAAKSTPKPAPKKR